ncbi:hypothetical protein [Lysobacter sp. CA199]|uniref:hypothetical protein n=1 Tax=Lysobacter sp. CA199 TaxID=3455608 RepID=UPI003F8D2DB7
MSKPTWLPGIVSVYAAGLSAPPCLACVGDADSHSEETITADSHRRMRFLRTGLLTSLLKGLSVAADKTAPVKCVRPPGAAAYRAEATVTGTDFELDLERFVVIATHQSNL